MADEIHEALCAAKDAAMDRAMEATARIQKARADGNQKAIDAAQKDRDAAMADWKMASAAHTRASATNAGRALQSQTGVSEIVGGQDYGRRRG